MNRLRTGTILLVLLGLAVGGSSHVVAAEDAAGAFESGDAGRQGAATACLVLQRTDANADPPVRLRANESAVEVRVDRNASYEVACPRPGP